MTEQDFNERMEAAQAHGALVSLSVSLAEANDYDASFLAWLLTGSHDWDFDEQAYDADVDSCY